MTLSTACPKPKKKTDREKRVEKIVHAWSKKKVWRQRAIDRDRAKPRTPVKQRNEARIKRKAVAYRKVIASPFNRELRYKAYARSGGMCECDQCTEIRATIEVENRFTLDWGFASDRFADTQWTRGEVAAAFTPIPCWFVSGGGAPWRRFRSTDGELHHAGAKGKAAYSLFGQENPDELALVQWTWKSCHARIEAKFGTRRRFLHGRSS